MPVSIYNTLTRKKEPFVPLEPQQIKMYVCGPTVYDEPHIGHARSAYVFDVIRRYLKYRNYNVKFVRNVTDVDDKIIEKAGKEFKGEDLNAAVAKVSKKYLDSYHEDMKSLEVEAPDFEPKATEYLNKDDPKSMQKFIERLIENNAAYVSGGDVYFDIKKAKDYGKLSGQSLEKMEAGARIAVGEKKKDPLDFALWKAAKEDEPSWDSPWGRGRPGWHIECSVMSSAILGDEFDIHGGGLDLIFPHHENEIAQSEAAGKKFAKVWMHHGLLTINGQKMAKSLGNFITIKDFIAKYKDADILKLFFLSAHYTQPIDYTEAKITEIKHSLERINIFLWKVHDVKFYGLPWTQKPIAEIENIRKDFINAMDDDFNTPKALASIFDLITLANKHIDDFEFIKNAELTLADLTGAKIFGLSLTKTQFVITPTDKEIEGLLLLRKQAREEKKYAQADNIRKMLEAKGIVLEDSKEGTTWRRKL